MGMSSSKAAHDPPTCHPNRRFGIRPATGGTDRPSGPSGRWGDALQLVDRYTRGRVRSTGEVLAYLRRHGVSSSTAAHVIAASRARGSLDDHACARLWADHWARRGYAWSAIRARLTAKGLAEDVIDAGLRRLAAEATDEDRARALVASSLRRRGTRPVDVHSVARALQARGFDEEVIARVLQGLAE